MQIGYTPLHHTSLNGNTELVELLTERGSQMDVPAAVHKNGFVIVMYIKHVIHLPHAHRIERAASLLWGWPVTMDTRLWLNC